MGSYQFYLSGFKNHPSYQKNGDKTGLIRTKRLLVQKMQDVICNNKGEVIRILRLFYESNGKLAIFFFAKCGSKYLQTTKLW